MVRDIAALFLFLIRIYFLYVDLREPFTFLPLPLFLDWSSVLGVTQSCERTFCFNPLSFVPLVFFRDFQSAVDSPLPPQG